MHGIRIPGTHKVINTGSIVVLSRFPNVKWILKNGWYKYEEEMYNGWYFSSILHRENIPVLDNDLINIKIISGEQCDTFYDPNQSHCRCNCDSGKPTIRRSVEEYVCDTDYMSGQLLWLIPGVLYQVTHDFHSSSSFESTVDNMTSDISAGNLASISSSDIKEFEISSFAVNFKSAFGTDSPDISDANRYLGSFTPQILPHAGIEFLNVDEASDTYSSIYKYLKIPDTSELIFVCIASTITNSDIDRLFK